MNQRWTRVAHLRQLTGRSPRCTPQPASAGAARQPTSRCFLESVGRPRAKTKPSVQNAKIPRKKLIVHRMLGVENSIKMAPTGPNSKLSSAAASPVETKPHPGGRQRVVPRGALWGPGQPERERERRTGAPACSDPDVLRELPNPVLSVLAGREGAAAHVPAAAGDSGLCVER